MGKAKKANSKKPQSGPREVTPDVHNDNVASNLLSFQKPSYKGVSKDNKTRNRAISKSKVPIKKTKQRVYTEKELGIPKLNTALNPVGVQVKGKKGKKFVNDTSLQLILAEVQQESNEAHASKLERARQLETIREAKRKEIEEREQKQKEKVESKRHELKNKSKKKSSEEQLDDSKSRPATQKKSKKRVAFAE